MATRPGDDPSDNGRTPGTMGDDSAMNDPSDGHCLGCGCEAGYAMRGCLCVGRPLDRLPGEDE